MSNQKTVSAVIGGIVIIAAAVALIALRGGYDPDEPRTADGSTLAGDAEISSQAAAPAPRQVPASQAESDKRQEPAPSAAKLAPPPAAGSDQKVSTRLDTLVDPDPVFEKALAQARFSPRGWKTDFSLHSIAYDEISSGGVPRDGIPPLDNPSFTIPEIASDWLSDQEPVIALDVNGQSRAYPLQIITWHEIVNDTLGGVPVAVTFCPLCNSALVFDRTIGGDIHTFGVSGNLRNSDLIMWDRQTETWWQQFTGEGIVGELTGTRLKILPAVIISWIDFKTANPGGSVLSRDTGFNRPYGSNPYAGYDRVDLPPFLFKGDTDGRLLPKERVVAVSIGSDEAAFPFSILEEERIVAHEMAGQDIVVFYKPGTKSALDNYVIADSRDVGATGVFIPQMDGQNLTFRSEEDGFVDDQTGSEWNILGQALDGPLAGRALEPVVHANHFWFAWGAFKPNTHVYAGKQG
jgi:hypothetical protein